MSGEVPMDPEQMGIHEEQEGKEMEPTAVLDYVAKLGRDLEECSIRAQAIIEEAKERNIPINLAGDATLKKFAPLGEYEIMLVNLRSELLKVQDGLLAQGVRMTHEDMNSRLEKMNQSK